MSETETAAPEELEAATEQEESAVVDAEFEDPEVDGPQTQADILRDELRDRKKEMDSLRGTRNDKEHELILTERARIIAELEAEFGDLLKEAERQYEEAKKAYREELDRVAKSGEGAAYPLGHKFVKWESDGATRYRRDAVNTYTKTGERAIYEVITSESVVQGNLASYSRPRIGEYVLRLCDKKGNPGKKILRQSHNWSIEEEKKHIFNGWHPEGYDPNTKEAEKTAAQKAEQECLAAEKKALRDAALAKLSDEERAAILEAK